MTRKEINSAKSALRPFVRSMMTFSIPGCGLGLSVEYNDGYSANFWSLYQVENKVAEMTERAERKLPNNFYKNTKRPVDTGGSGR